MPISSKGEIVAIATRPTAPSETEWDATNRVRFFWKIHYGLQTTATSFAVWGDAMTNFMLVPMHRSYAQCEIAVLTHR